MRPVPARRPRGETARPSARPAAGQSTLGVACWACSIGMSWASIGRSTMSLRIASCSPRRAGFGSGDGVGPRVAPDCVRAATATAAMRAHRRSTTGRPSPAPELCRKPSGRPSQACLHDAVGFAVWSSQTLTPRLPARHRWSRAKAIGESGERPISDSFTRWRTPPGAASCPAGWGDARYATDTTSIPSRAAARLVGWATTVHPRAAAPPSLRRGSCPGDGAPRRQPVGVGVTTTPLSP